MTRHRLRAAVAAMAMAALVLGCQAGGPSDAPRTVGDGQSQSIDGEPRSGGTLVVGIGSYPHSLNYNLAPSAPSYSVYRAILEHLVVANTDEGGGLEPALAESWELIDDTTWQFKLREDVTWHDGTPFTADDVVATIDLVLNGEPEAYFKSRISDAVEAVKVDDYTVNILTSKSSALLPVGLADIYIHQAKQIQEGGNDAITAAPIGTGQYKLGAREEGVSITVERFDDYWGEPAHLDSVVFRAIPEDATRVAALERGEIDIAYNIPPDDAPRLNDLDAVDVVSVPVGQVMLIQFALGAIPDDHPLQDARVRQALNYAVDKQTLVDSLLYGYAELAPGQIVAADGLGNNEELDAYPYDPERARELLAEAGYPDGFEFTVTTGQGRYVKQVEIPEAIAGQLAEVGVEMAVDVQEWSAVISGMTVGELPAYYAGWNYFPVMDGDFVVQHYRCDGPFLLMCNDEFDELFAEQRSTPDAGERDAILADMMSILHEEAPAIFLFQSPDIFGVSSRVHDFMPMPDNMVHLDSIWVEDAE